MIRLPSRNINLLKIIALPLITLIALLLRLYRLGFESIWVDEAQSIFYSFLSPRELVTQLAGDIHPPLYFLLLNVWSRFGEGEFWLRLPSALAGAASVPLLYLIGKKIAGRRVGLIAALLLALNPMHIYYSQEMRSFTLSVLFMLATVIYLLRAAETPNLKNLAGFAAGSLLTAYTHYLPMLAITCVVLAVIVDLTLDSDRRKRTAIIPILYTGAIATALYFPWLPTMIKQVGVGGGSWVGMIAGSLSLKQMTDVLYEFVCGKVKPHTVGTILSIVIAGGSLAAFLPRRVKGENNRRANLYLLAFFIFPLLVTLLYSLSKNMFIARYLIAALPGFLLALAIGLDRLPRIVAAIDLLLIVLMFSVAIDHTYHKLDKPDWRQRTAEIIRQARDDDAILFYTNWAQSPFYLYRQWMKDTRPLKIVSFRDLPRQADRALIANLFGANITKIAHQSDRVWFFDIHRFRYDKQGLALEYMKARYPVIDAINESPRVYLFDLTQPRF